MYEGKSLRDKLRSGDTCLGIFSALTDPCVAEMLSGAGFDFIVIDAEHGALDLETVQVNIMAIKGSSTVPLVRVPDVDEVYIKRVLDAGAGGIVVPQVRSAEDARRAVGACLYPPSGNRGIGPRRPSNYGPDTAEVLAAANDHLVIWIQIENIQAIEAIDQIAEIPGLAGLIIGPRDLTVSLGVALQKQHPRVLDAIEKVRSSAHRAGVPVGMPGLTDPSEAIDWIRKGFQIAILGNTDGLLLRSSRELVAAIRKIA